MLLFWTLLSLFPLLPASSRPTNNTFLNSVSSTSLGETAAQRGFRLGQVFHLVVEVSAEAVIVSTVALSDADVAGENSLSGRQNSHDLPYDEKSVPVDSGALQN